MKTDLESKIVELYRNTATKLPEDVAHALNLAEQTEQNLTAKSILRTVLKNVELAETEDKPLCQDTGTPYFYIKIPNGYSQKQLIDEIGTATIKATAEIPLRPNAVDSQTGENLGNIPVIHFEESDKFEITLMLKGGGSENVSQIYKLPDETINADRSLEGVRKCVLGAVYKAQGKGCPPYIVGVAVGGSVEEVAGLSKKQLLRKLSDTNNDKELAKFEDELLSEINTLGIGPMGLGGDASALSVKISTAPRHPATYFVGVSFSCWALRRQTLCIK